MGNAHRPLPYRRNHQGQRRAPPRIQDALRRRVPDRYHQVRKARPRPQHPVLESGRLRAVRQVRCEP